MNVVQENELGCAVCVHAGLNKAIDEYYCNHHPDPEDVDAILKVEPTDRCEWFKADE